MKKEIYHGECESIFNKSESAKPRKKLVFTKYLNINGVTASAVSQPIHFEHVKHIESDFYIAWNESNITKSLYIGHYE